MFGSNPTLEDGAVPVHTATRRAGPTVLAALVVGVGVTYICLTMSNFLLFHVVVEGVAILVMAIICAIGWHSRRMADSPYMLFLATACGTVALLDLLHTLTFAGMGVVPTTGPELGLEAWVSARYMQALAMLLAPLVVMRPLRVGIALVAYPCIAGFLLATIFVWDLFPPCWMDGVGLTTFKKVSEFAVIGALGIAGWLHWRIRARLPKDTVRWLLASIAVLIAAEVLFTLYRDPTDMIMRLGHLLRIASAALLYRAFIWVGLLESERLLFASLRDRAEGYRTAQRAARVVSWSLDLATGAVSVPDGFGVVLGMAPEEFGGTAAAFRELIHPEDRAQSDEELRAALEGRDSLDSEFRVRHADGSMRWVRATGTLVCDAAGKPERLEGVLQDITAHKEAELLVRTIARESPVMQWVGEAESRSYLKGVSRLQRADVQGGAGNRMATGRASGRLASTARPPQEVSCRRGCGPPRVSTQKCGRRVWLV